jgi:hypothetical protein
MPNNKTMLHNLPIDVWNRIARDLSTQNGSSVRRTNKTLSKGFPAKNTNASASKIASGRKGQITRRRINKSNGTNFKINGKTRMSKNMTGSGPMNVPIWTYYDGIGGDRNGQFIQRIYLPGLNFLYRFDQRRPGHSEKTAYSLSYTGATPRTTPG